MSRIVVHDRAAEVLTSSSLGRSRELTPDGFLLCKDVRVARCGTLLYSADELGIAAKDAPEGIVAATCSADDLFRQETLDSVLGKSITDEHPPEDVNPKNYRVYDAGVALNPRRGEGPDADWMICDLLVKDDLVITAINQGKREISLGYDAEYEVTGPGKARKYNIIVNHVALVPQGRCGPSCSIGDAEMKTRDAKVSVLDRIRNAMKTKDEAEFKKAIEDAKDEMSEAVGDPDPDVTGGQHKVIIEVRGPGAEANPQTSTPPKVEDAEGEGEAAPAWFTKFATGIESRLAKLEGGTQDAEIPGDVGKVDTDMDEGKTWADEDMPDGEKDPDPKATGDKTRDGKTRDAKFLDSVKMEPGFRDTLARAELLAPGFRIPTFDAKVPAYVTAKRICGFRKRVLDAAMADAATEAVIKGVVGSVDVGRLTCDSVRTKFIAASELMRAKNNGRVGSVRFVDASASTTKPGTPADINARNREFWTKKGGLA